MRNHRIFETLYSSISCKELISLISEYNNHLPLQGASKKTNDQYIEIRDALLEHDLTQKVLNVYVAVEYPTVIDSDEPNNFWITSKQTSVLSARIIQADGQHMHIQFTEGFKKDCYHYRLKKVCYTYRIDQNEVISLLFDKKEQVFIQKAVWREPVFYIDLLNSTLKI